MLNISYHIFPTKLGWVGITGRDGKISRLELPRQNRIEAEAVLRGGMADEFVESRHDFSELAEQIAAYFACERVHFDCEIDVDTATAFEKKTSQAAREIGYGELQTYGWLASRIGQPKAYRAVGQALGRNPIPIIVPCHRVIGSDGSMRGFGCGVEWKLRLIDMEHYGLHGRKSI